MATILFILFVLVSVLLVGVVLLQKGRGGGLSGAFGGAGGHSAFGTRTGDMLTWVTVALIGLFLLLAIVAVRVYRPARVQAGPPVPPADSAALPGAPTTEPATQPGEMEPTVPIEAPATAPVTAPAGAAR